MGVGFANFLTLHPGIIDVERSSLFGAHGKHCAAHERAVFIGETQRKSRARVVSRTTHARLINVCRFSFVFDNVHAISHIVKKFGAVTK